MSALLERWPFDDPASAVASTRLQLRERGLPPPCLGGASGLRLRDTGGHLSIGTTWSEFVPHVELHASITGGSLSLSSSSLLNRTDYAWTNAEVLGSVWKNGSRAGALTISSTTGAITMSGLAVSTGDEVELRFQFLGVLSAPWYTTALLQRSFHLQVPSSSTTVDFDADDNPMPVPELDLAFGWDASDQFKVGVRVTDDDGATQDMDALLKKHGVCPDSPSSTAFDLSATGSQTLTATLFDKEDIDLSWSLDLQLRSTSGTTYVKDRITLAFFDVGAVGPFPASFATSGTMLQQVKTTGGGAELRRP